MRTLLTALLLVGCKGPSDPDPGGEIVHGLLGDGPLNPFPTRELVDEDGFLAIPGEALPATTTPLDVERFQGWRTGFSPAQTAVLRLPGIDPSRLPSYDAPTPGEGSVRLADLTVGEWLPVLAELDAWEGAVEPALLIRPLVHLPAGHRIAVAVTTEAVARPAPFDQVLAGESDVDGVHYAALLSELAALGLPEDEVAVAWDFPIGDGARPLRSATSQVTLDGGFHFERIRDLDDGDHVALHTWRAAEGRFTVQDFLVDDAFLNLAADGSVSPSGVTEADLYVHIPTSVADAPEGTVPVLIFGHGIFGWPGRYLDDKAVESGVNALAEELGMIVVATTWRGLTFNDRVEVIQASQDLGRLPVVTDRLVQGLVNTQSLVELTRDPTFRDHEVLRGRSGQVLIDPERTYYYGISLGAIEGMVLLAQGAPLDAAAFHVGGSMWSTMLERSSNWLAFELFVTETVPDPADRQLMYALSQLFWDPVDPMSWAPELSELDFLLQEAIGDEQVPNFTTEALARSVGLPVLEPRVTSPLGIEPIAPDLPPGSRALAQFDPEVALPAPVNRPADVTGAHDLPRTWPGTHAQTVDYLTPGAEGQIRHHCGDAPCSASNPGFAPVPPEPEE